jgi:hypothetical protein
MPKYANTQNNEKHKNFKRYALRIYDLPLNLADIKVLNTILLQTVPSIQITKIRLLPSKTQKDDELRKVQFRIACSSDSEFEYIYERLRYIDIGPHQYRILIHDKKLYDEMNNDDYAN